MAMAQSNKLVWVVEDEADLAELVRFNLEKEGYTAECFGDSRRALTEMKREKPDLIILDRMLPGMSGDEFIGTVRRTATVASIPIIMLTAKAEESDQLVGFALGADDYILKPFSMKLLLARVGAIFRRGEGFNPDADTMTVGPVTLDLGRYTLMVNEQVATVTATEFKLIKALVSANGRVLSRSQLIDQVLGTGVAVTDRTIDVHVTALRKKLGDAAGWLQTIRGIGYTFREPQ
jgi:two-component system phosphate regulon response regulator PhoB